MSDQAAEREVEIEERVLDMLASEALDVLFYPPELLGKESAWWSHVPFAFWIMSVCRPRVFVELGTHNGVSYSAFLRSKPARTGRCALLRRRYMGGGRARGFL